MAKLRDGLETIKLRKWKNQHENFTYKPEAKFRYKLKNPFDARTNKLKRYNETTENIKAMIRHALDHNFRIRAIGSGWSYTKIGIARDCFVDTKSLNLSFSISNKFCNQKYLDKGGKAGDNYFVQCGKSIRQLNHVLENQLKEKRSIIASGASNGQTIAGATSTGTHGAAFKVGAVHDAIIGLHIVTSHDDHIFLQPGTDPVFNDQFAQVINARPVCDDDIFNSAIVSFGSFGFIHGIMIKTDPIFLLEKWRIRTPLTDKLKNAMNTLQFDDLALPRPSEGTIDQLYHFQVLINPYNIKNNGKGVYIQAMYKIPYRSNYPKINVANQKYTYGDDSLGVLSIFLNNLKLFRKKITAGLVNNLINLQYNDNDKFPWFGTIGETFSYTPLRGKTSSTAIGIDLKDTAKALNVVLKIVDKKPLPGVVAFRYVKGSRAKLAFTKFDLTCIMELDGLDSDDMTDFYNKVWDELENEKIPFTLHWGKVNDYVTRNQNKVTKMYGSERVETWIKSRCKVLATDEMRDLFTNDYMIKCGLDRVIIEGPGHDDDIVT